MYFYWTVRSRKEAAWFKQVLEAINSQDMNNFIEINIHITSIRDSSDIRVMLLKLAQVHDTNTKGICPVAHMKTKAIITRFGRPNWNEVFGKVKDNHLGQVLHCGVFFCGPYALGKILKTQCMKHTSKDMNFIFKQEIFY